MSRAEDFVNFEGVEPPEHLMQGLIEEIHNLMRDHNFDELNRVMLLPNENSSKYVYIFFLRSSCHFKKEIVNWVVLRDNAVKWLNARGINPKDLLHGLLD